MAKWRVLDVGWSRKAGVVPRVEMPMGCGMRRGGLGACVGFLVWMWVWGAGIFGNGA